MSKKTKEPANILKRSNAPEASLIDMPRGSYLVRRINGDLVISYVAKQSVIRHCLVPKTKNNPILKLNPHLLTEDHVIQFIVRECADSLLYPLPRENGDSIEETYEDLDPNVCHVCGIISQNSARLKDHINQSHRIKNCNKCMKVVLSYYHWKTCPETEIKYKCEKCNYKTSHPNHLKQHEKTHKKQTFPCRFCPKMLQSLEMVEKHTRNNHGRFVRMKCEYCELSFTTLRARKNHVRTMHVSIKEEVFFRCRSCYEILKTSSDLDLHKKTMHSKKKLGPFPCPDCFKEFSSTKLLNKHKKRNICKIEEKSELFIFLPELTDEKP